VSGSGKGNNKGDKKETVLLGGEECYHTLVEGEHEHVVSEGIIELAAHLTATEQWHWILDSGASSHLCNDRSLTVDMQVCDISVRIGKGHLRATGVGSVRLNFKVGSVATPVKISKVLFVPGMVCNLFSAEAFKEKGMFYCNEDNTRV
jgi:hypothetical protein